MEKITAIYHISAPAGSIEKITRDIAFEQTVEVPEHLVQSQDILDQVVGRVTSLKPLSTKAHVFEAEIQYNAELAHNQLPQLLNLVYGNISIKNNVKLVDVQLPDSFVSRFRGPNFGIQGIRRLLGCYGRPLLATALKPRGTSPKDLAAMAYQFALGGGDIVKDDHNLIDASFEQFQHRVQICLEAVEKANATTHHNTL
ncbi:MAG: ribulose 1,5-bisphosphate carboxylase large subunit, partial [Calditrichaeota bacterium]